LVFLTFPRCFDWLLQQRIENQPFERENIRGKHISKKAEGVTLKDKQQASKKRGQRKRLISQNILIIDNQK